MAKDVITSVGVMLAALAGVYFISKYVSRNKVAPIKNITVPKGASLQQIVDQVNTVRKGKFATSDDDLVSMADFGAAVDDNNMVSIS